ncbi:unnamed protein product, partial [Mesorhabditis belari]|uniref:Uncharacterized protein n=1 Tax=Mesorhabditis belari TaxID=2138241 RepID=A0AAF3FHX1_9BILA
MCRVKDMIDYNARSDLLARKESTIVPIAISARKLRQSLMMYGARHGVVDVGRGIRFTIAGPRAEPTVMTIVTKLITVKTSGVAAVICAIRAQPQPCFSHRFSLLS